MLARISTLCAFFIILMGEVYPQPSPLEHSYDQFDSQYGLNQLLYNGRKYTPEHTYVKGNPFLYDEQFIEGELIIKGKTFTGVMLKYDIYKQQFIMAFEDRNKANQQLVIPSLLIDSLWISHAVFINAEPYGLGEGFVQVVAYADLKIMYEWSKDYQFTATKNDIPHVYSDARRSAYLYRKNKAYKYRSQGAFVKLFPVEWQKQIKTYLKEHKVKLKKASDSDMTGVLTFINSLK